MSFFSLIPNRGPFCPHPSRKEVNMKKNKKKRFPKRRKDFRYHSVKVIKKTGKSFLIDHPAYIFLEKRDTYIYITITHSKNIEGKVLIQLKKNPNPNDEKESYWVLEIKEDAIDSFGKKIKGWKIDPLDDQEIREQYKISIKK